VADNRQAHLCVLLRRAFFVLAVSISVAFLSFSIVSLGSSRVSTEGQWGTELRGKNLCALQ
jgi:hypothetical protein